MLSEIKQPAEAIRDALEPIELPTGSPGGTVLCAAIVLVAIAAFAIRWMLRRRQPDFHSACNRAQRRLDNINPNDGEPRWVFQQLRGILADYLTARVGIAASRQTSAEILCALREAGFTDLGDLQTFLEQSDRARFSTACHFMPQNAIEGCRQVIAKLDGRRNATV